jgi:hypothetical protein
MQKYNSVHFISNVVFQVTVIKNIERLEILKMSKCIRQQHF